MPLLVLHVVEAVIAGTRRNVYSLATGLDQSRFRAHVACPLRREGDWGEDGFVEDLRRAGCAITPLPLRRSISPAHDAAALQALVVLLGRERPDLVHTHSSKAGFVGRLAARIAGIPAVHTPHGLHFLGQRSPLKRRFYLQLERVAASWCSRIIATSPGEERELLRWRIAAAAQIVQIANGVSLAPAMTQAERDALRAEHSIPASAPLVATLARVTEQKNPQLFLRAAALVARELPEAHFLWVGTGELLDEARTFAQELGLGATMHFVGHIESGAALLPICDAFWLTSRFEGMPYALLEALACGLPAIATDVVGNRDALDDGRCGLLVPPDDPVALAQSTLRILADSAEARGLGARGRERVLAHFTQHRMLERTGQLYEEVTGMGQRPFIDQVTAFGR
jgi:glycosyltransferase involved in cell wall biosynthesis